jgi:AcrR family transcriptional regulator
MPSTQPSHAGGRPRSTAADHSILVATLELLEEHGYARLTIEAVAGRAGVGRPTVYRRWPNKPALVSAAVAHAWPPVPEPPDSDIVTALHSFLSATINDTVTSSIGRLMPHLLAAAVDDPELGTLYRSIAVEPRRRVAVDIIRRGIESGQFRPAIDADLMADKIIGPVIYRSLVRAVPPLDDGELRTLIEEVCAAATCGS